MEGWSEMVPEVILSMEEAEQVSSKVVPEQASSQVGPEQVLSPEEVWSKVEPEVLSMVVLVLPKVGQEEGVLTKVGPDLATKRK
jgi:hypothetical protein